MAGVTTEKELREKLATEDERIRARGPIQRGWTFVAAKPEELSELERVSLRLREIAGEEEYEEEYAVLYKRYMEIT